MRLHEFYEAIDKALLLKGCRVLDRDDIWILVYSLEHELSVQETVEHVLHNRESSRPLSGGG